MARSKTLGSSPKAEGAGVVRRARNRPAARDPKSVANMLDELLPLAEPGALEIHLNAAVLELGEPAQLLELAADPAIGPLLLCRLAPNVALVDPGRARELADVLRRRGYTPKILKRETSDAAEP
jgi:hypothetical protein